MDGVTSGVQQGTIGVSTNGQLDLLGQPIVITTDHRGFNPAELAEMFVNKLLAVSVDLPPDQLAAAHAYRDRILALATVYMGHAQNSARTTTYNLLADGGFRSAAEFMKDK